MGQLKDKARMIRPNELLSVIIVAICDPKTQLPVDNLSTPRTDKTVMDLTL